MKNRIYLIDSLRGLAILMMISFHFCYDLQYFKIYNFHITSNPFFLNYRIVIVSLFLFIVGVSLVLAHKRGINWQKVKKRVLTLGLAALLISLATYFVFPHTWIYFGVIHFIFLASLLGLFFLNYPKLSALLGALIILLYNFGILNMHYIFKKIAPLLHLPMRHTEDLVPLIPWFGVVLLGIAFAKSPFFKFLQNPDINKFAKKIKLLNFLGEHALVIYLIHQPILFALFWVFLSIIS